MRINAGAAGAHGGGAGGEGEIVIGLVNIVPAAAMRATERNFAALLNDGPGGRKVRLKLFSLGAADGRYQNIDALWETALDGLIVTGAEPRAAAMRDEPLWPTLSRLVDWAGRHTASTIWSCFAAHAAAYRLDGIARQRLPGKLSGVFECTQSGAHPLMAALPARFFVPHSRGNTLNENVLHNHGYTILSQALATGADAFTKPHLESQFLFLQGHPEYVRSTLLFEYTRDIKRFLDGAQGYPQMPARYFEPEVAAALRGLRRGLEQGGGMALFADFNWAAVDVAAPDWQPAAAALYSGWLAVIAARKTAGVSLAA